MGKGFAGVASDISSLPKHTSTHTRNIKEMVEVVLGKIMAAEKKARYSVELASKNVHISAEIKRVVDDLSAIVNEVYEENSSVAEVCECSHTLSLHIQATSAAIKCQLDQADGYSQALH